MAPITDSGILAMILGAGLVVKAVLLILILLSVWSWAIMFAKWLQFRKARSESTEFSNIFWETRNFARVDDSSKRLDASPLAQVFDGGYKELNHVLQDPAKSEAASAEPAAMLNTVERALKRAEYEQSVRLESGITFLASVASSAPFIGLFGTVWGIMNAFHGLSYAKATTIQAVAPGISEALVATAIGLAAAIPAVIAYNYFVAAVRQFKDSMDKFSSEFLSVARGYVNQAGKL